MRVLLAETAAHEVTRILLQCNTIRSGIGVEQGKTFWPGATNLDALPDMVPGKIAQWVRKADYTLRVSPPGVLKTRRRRERERAWALAVTQACAARGRGLEASASQPKRKIERE